ncbi:hypothetical protein [Brevibacterium litoralis]|uniref:hypothetical protein n=1 Tax=Brevibacterium litoralis TaxID=3138935 RepID=UPI0032ECEFB8
MNRKKNTARGARRSGNPAKRAAAGTAAEQAAGKAAEAYSPSDARDSSSARPSLGAAVTGKIERNEDAPRTKAPLLVAGVALLAVAGVVVWNIARPGAVLTIDDLETPAVGALHAGSALYPENSRDAVDQVVKFGYLPAVDLALLSDGTPVLADEETAPAALGLDGPVSSWTLDAFTSAEIAPPGAGAAVPPESSGDDSDADAADAAGADASEASGWSRPGTPMTWEDALDRYGDMTVFMPAVDSAEEARAVVATVEGATVDGATGAGDTDGSADGERPARPDGIILRSADLDVLRIGVDAGLTTLYEGDLTGLDPSALSEAGVQMVAVGEGASGAGDSTSEGGADGAAVDLDAWLGSDLRVWATGVADEQALAELAAAGVYGALADNPFAVQPSSVKDD